MINRRQWLYGVGVVAGAAARPGSSFGRDKEKDNQDTQTAQRPSLDLSDFEPKSMLRVHESRVERAKFPVIDFHTHITVSARSRTEWNWPPSANIWERRKNFWLPWIARISAPW